MNAVVEYLNQEYQNRKRKNASFSIRSFSRWLGVSPAQLSQVMNGKRPVSIKFLGKITDKLNLSPSEQRNLLKKINHKYLLDQNLTNPQNHLNEDIFNIISDWPHMAILSLTHIKNAKSDSRWIANKLNLSVKQVNDCVDRLIRLNLLQLKPFKQIGNPFHVMSNTPSAAIRKYHSQSLQLAIRKIESVQIDQREYQSITMPLNPDLIPKLKSLIDDFYEDALNLAKQKSDRQEVYQLNVQLYPLTEIIKREVPSK